MNLDAHLGNQFLPLRILRQPAGLEQVVRQRLLTIDVLAPLHGAHRYDRMHVVGRGDVHRIETPVFLIQQLAPVLIDPDLGKLLLEFHRAAQIHVRHGDQFELLEPCQLVDVLRGHAAGAKAGVTEQAVARASHQVLRYKRRGQRGHTESLEERTTVEG